MALLDPFAKVVQLKGGLLLVYSAGFAYVLAPKYGAMTELYSSLQELYPLPQGAADMLGGSLCAGLAPFLFGKAMKDYREKRRKRIETAGAKGKYRGLNFGPVRATETDLFTSVLTLGATGSGKTSRILLPALEDLINTYNVEDPKIGSKDPFQKLGGFVLEVKGKFFETIVYLVHNAGRNSSTDVRVIRGNSSLPIVELVDEAGRKFFLNGQPCSSGSEVSIFYRGIKLKSGGSIESTLFKKIREQDRKEIEPELKRITLPVFEDTKLDEQGAVIAPGKNPRDIRFLGWRWRQGKLHRVSHTHTRDKPVYTGEIITPPQTLRYVRTLFVNNGLRYNLIDPKVPSSEAAQRIAMVAKMVTGEGKGGGDNAFFYQAASKAIENSINLFRAVNPKTQCTVLDINRIIAQSSALQSSLTKLTGMITALEEKRIEEERRGDRFSSAETAKLITQYDDLNKWFVEEWEPMKKTNTGSSIISTVSNLFGPFMRDPYLQETFCQTATFSFDECIQKGTIYAFVPGPEYELNARLLGTVLKSDWQRSMLQRVSEGSDGLNKNRIILGVADECQSFIISGSQDSGDPKFMSLSRESKVINMAATQSEAWVYAALAQKEADVWLQSYRTRVWLTQTHQETNKNASALCGRIKREKRSADENINVKSILDGSGQAKQKFDYEDVPRFEPHIFTNLPDDEAIVFNNGQALRNAGLGGCPAIRGKVPWRKITSDDGIIAIADRMRWWAVENWENELFAINESSILDHDVHPKNADSDSKSDTVSSSESSKPAPTGQSGVGDEGTLPTTETASPSETNAVQSDHPESPTTTSHPLNPNLQVPGGAILLTGLSAPTIKAQAATPEVHQDPDDKVLPAQAAAPTMITPAQIEAQEKAYQELVAANPFLLVEYRDNASIGRSVAGARQSHSVISKETKLVGAGGHVGGNTTAIEKVTERDRLDDIYRTPADMLDDSPLDEMARRTVGALPGNDRAPDGLKGNNPISTKGWGL